MLQTVSKCRSVFTSCVLFEHRFIIELFGLMTASFKYTLIFLAGLITSLKLHEESHLKRLAVGE